ncbi:MAG: nuclease-related domain-containing protein [Trebonia sp.]|uniref:nuclease-related domain-containing protein n=1 Tax=Trebonia sp. TaxID=2767075 RepID=UPI003BB14E14
MQVSVTPAPDADRAEGTKQNAGVNGTRYSVSDRPGSPTSRWTAGGRRSANGRQAASPPKAAGVQYADSGVDDVSAEIDEATDVNGGRRRDDGIAILEGVVTTEVPPDEPPTADLDVPQPAWNQQVSRPRPVRAAATGSAAAGERTSSGELPVSVTPPAWDSGQRRIGVRDLPPDVRLRMWRFRAIVVIVVGVVFTIVASWQVGLSLAILAGVIDTVYRSRTAADIEAGGSEAAARRRTRRQLSRLRRAGYQALNARPIPGSREVIDHLVIGPTGVYAIDSERWHKRVPIRTYNGKQLWHGPENKKQRLEHANWEAQQASERLSTAVGFDVPVRAAMAIYGPKIPWDIATIKDVDVFTGTALGKYLKRRGRMRSLPRLSKEQVQAIYDSASSVLPDVGPARTFTPVG